MARYVALIRGVNVSGKNKLPMAGLKAGVEALGFAEVRTYLNSGNVAFDCDGGDCAALSGLLAAMLKDRFGLDVPVFVIPQDGLSDILSHAPDWWGGADELIYDNLIFIIPPTTFADVFGAIGAPKDGLERIADCGAAIFWSFSRKDYQKTNWWPKTAGAGIGGRLTIRTANTVRRIAAM